MIILIGNENTIDSVSNVKRKGILLPYVVIENYFDGELILNTEYFKNIINTRVMECLQYNNAIIVFNNVKDILTEDNHFLFGLLQGYINSGKKVYCTVNTINNLPSEYTSGIEVSSLTSILNDITTNGLGEIPESDPEQMSEEDKLEFLSKFEE